MTEQEKFEKWAKSRSSFYLDRRDHPARWNGSPDEIKRWEDNPYSYAWTSGAWEAWKYQVSSAQEPRQEPKSGINLADAVLAGADGPAPVAPTNEELRDLAYQFTTSTGLGERFNEFGFARAVLKRWGGRQESEPVITAEEAEMIAAPWSYLDPPKPAPTLADEESLRITVRDSIPLNGSPSEVAVAAILAVADWMEQHSVVSELLNSMCYYEQMRSSSWWVSRLRREVRE